MTRCEAFWVAVVVIVAFAVMTAVSAFVTWYAMPPEAKELVRSVFTAAVHAASRIPFAL